MSSEERISPELRAELGLDFCSSPEEVSDPISLAFLGSARLIESGMPVFQYQIPPESPLPENLMIALEPSGMGLWFFSVPGWEEFVGRVQRTPMPRGILQAILRKVVMPAVAATAHAGVLSIPEEVLERTLIPRGELLVYYNVEKSQGRAKGRFS